MLCHVLFQHQTMWHEVKYMSEWISGYNAGGCGNPPYQRNTQSSVYTGMSL